MSSPVHNGKPQASIVIPMWNGECDIVDCLRSIYQQQGVSFEVIVVDNASQDASADLVAQHFPQATLIKNTKNLGFSGGVNTGLRAAKGGLLVLLNQDTEVHPDWLIALVNAANDTSIGVLGSKAIYPDGRIQHAGGQINERGMGSHFGQFEQDDGHWDSVLDCDYVTGASMAISRSAFETVGFFDEGYKPAYFEDDDYCVRLRLAGYRVVYWPESVLVHKEASVMGASDHQGMVCFNRNRLRFVLKFLHTGLFDTFLEAERDWLISLRDQARVLAHLALYRELLHGLYANSSDVDFVSPSIKPQCIHILTQLATQAAQCAGGSPITFSQPFYADNAHISADLKVLVINPNFPPVGYLGGAEISCYHTTKALISKGIQAEVLSINTKGTGDLDEHYTYENIPVHRVMFRTYHRTPELDLFDQRMYDVVQDAIRAFIPDIVHIHNASGTSLAPFKACEDADIPTVCTLHDSWLLCPNNMLYRLDGSLCDTYHEPKNCKDCFRKLDFWADIPHRRRVFQEMTKHVRYFISPTQALMDRHIEAGYDPLRFVRVHLGFDAGEAVSPKHEGVQRLLTQVNHSDPKVLFTGGGHDYKGANIILKALPMMLRHVENLQVIIAGSGDRSLLRRMQALSPMVTVLGQVPFTDMRMLMSLVDLVVIPSIVHENSPVTIFEAYQVGTPVLASNYGGIPELITSNHTGYLFKRGCSECLSEQIIKHFARPIYERRQMRRYCLETVNTVLDLDSHVEGIMDVYAKVLE